MRGNHESLFVHSVLCDYGVLQYRRFFAGVAYVVSMFDGYEVIVFDALV